MVIYINPPYAEAATVRQKTGTGTNKANVARNNSVYSKYKTLMGGAVNELFAQFFIRIYNEIPSSVLAEFSTLKKKNSASTELPRFPEHFPSEAWSEFFSPGRYV